MNPFQAQSIPALATTTLLPLIAAALGLMPAALIARQNPPLSSPYSYVHHTVSTAIPAAQEAFDRGLTLIFAYQPDEAEQSFRQAARLDPSLAMAWWGIGLTLGPNINDPPERPKTLKAAAALARAKVLAATHATPPERDYVAALEARYTADPEPDFDRLTMAYRDAMRELVHKYPDDADARALFAEAIMDVYPWRLWDAAGNPAPGTQELVDEIQTGLKRAPDHIGLLHFYIHAVEASNDAARALPAAQRLASLPMEPAAAHLVHMPAHIYMRTGDWESAVEANDHAVHHALDYKISKDPSAQRACGHCVDFLSYAYMMQGNQANARKSAEDYQKLTEDPTNSLAVLVRFRLWQEALAFPEPRADLKVFARNTHAIRGFWHFARGAAFAGSDQLDQAEGELQALNGEASLAPPPANFDGPPDVEHVLDKMSQTMEAVDLKIAAAILGSRIAEARQQMPRAIALMRDAVSHHDQILYSEPPAWFYPVRESLGALLLRTDSAAEAEAVFREDLRRSPNNPRSMLGLSAALAAQGESKQAAEARSRFQTAWKHSDVQIEVGQL